MEPTYPKEEIFSGKLRELARQQQQMAVRFRRYEQADLRQIRLELSQLEREEADVERRLRQSADTGRSPAVAALSRAQLDYLRRVRAILREKLPGYLHSEGTGALEDQAEAACLYGEYAIDAAAQAMRPALLAACAKELRMRARSRNRQNTPRRKHMNEVKSPKKALLTITARTAALCSQLPRHAWLPAAVREVDYGTLCHDRGKAIGQVECRHPDPFHR
jgi:hypothetical protein